jgi:hypothetical protein
MLIIFFQHLRPHRLGPENRRRSCLRRLRERTVFCYPIRPHLAAILLMISSHLVTVKVIAMEMKIALKGYIASRETRMKRFLDAAEATWTAAGRTTAPTSFLPPTPPSRWPQARHPLEDRLSPPLRSMPSQRLRSRPQSPPFLWNRLRHQLNRTVSWYPTRPNLVAILRMRSFRSVFARVIAMKTRIAQKDYFASQETRTKKFLDASEAT